MINNHWYKGDSSAIVAIFIPKDFTLYLSLVLKTEEKFEFKIKAY